MCHKISYYIIIMQIFYFLRRVIGLGLGKISQKLSACNVNAEASITVSLSNINQKLQRGVHALNSDLFTAAFGVKLKLVDF